MTPLFPTVIACNISNINTLLKLTEFCGVFNQFTPPLVVELIIPFPTAIILNASYAYIEL